MSVFAISLQTLLDRLASVDPGPLFILSLVPYLAFLWWARQVKAFPRLALRGFQLTLVFVAVTIVAAVIAEQGYGRQLADVDPLHGGAEAFLTLSNLVVVLGFLGQTPPPPSDDLHSPDPGSSPPAG